MSNAALIPDDETIARWYDGKDFSCDWTTGNIPVWANILHEHRDRAVRVLEIGSWEGRSALFFLNYLPKAHVVCIDPFAGNVEHQQNEYFAKLVPETEGRFDRNVVAPGGIVIFDDYNWDLMETEQERPKLGVDAFLAGIAGQYRLVHSEYQLVIAKS